MTIRALATLTLIPVCAASAQQFITFDDRPAKTYSSSAYAAQGISIGTAYFSETPTLGSVMELPSTAPYFTLVTFGASSAYATPPNGLFPEKALFGADLVFEFSTPITSLSFYTDFVSESPDTFTLVAFTKAEAGSYTVVDTYDYVDGATTLDGSYVSRSFATPVDVVAWIAPSTDGESIDNLSFTPIPEPATVSAAIGAFALLAAARRKKRS